MEARDFRGLGRAAQEALRRRALFLVEREGMTQAQAAVAVGVHRQTVNIWLRRYRERGEDGILDGRRVSPRRGKGLLTDAERSEEHTSELQSRQYLVCRLLLEKKKNNKSYLYN